MAVKLSQTSKMGCMSWSLQAIDTCPGSMGTDGELVAACKGCYATDGNYRFANVVKSREFNRLDWQRPDWSTDMVSALRKETYFRWFDSGDMYALGLARKILEVCRQTPHVKHWLPTRMHKFAKFSEVIASLESLPNVVVRFSSDDIQGGTVAGRNTSTIVPSPDYPTQAMVCGAWSRNGQCGPCRACWDQSVPVVAYPAHGRKMAKQQRLIALVAA